ncbi:MAG TPA: tetratricopeptide repeat protein, partial [Planctomycetaceae bacterium]|nr:tetratricopeptide repeat protein [Planctomycetaceae bacterium]
MTRLKTTYGGERLNSSLWELVRSICVLSTLSISGCLGGGSMNDMLKPEKLDVFLYQPQEHLQTTSNSTNTATPETSEIITLIETKKYREALERTTERIESGTDHQAGLAEFYLLRGVSNYLLHENERAIDDYSKAIELDPSDWRPVFHR